MPKLKKINKMANSDAEFSLFLFLSFRPDSESETNLGNERKIRHLFENQS